MTQDTWLKNIGAVQIGESYQSYSQMIENMMLQATEGTSIGDGSATESEWADYYDFVEKIPKAFQEVHGEDTSMGGCDVLNPYYQFCRFDDIVHPMTSNGYNNEGYGSIYSEMIADKQKILWLSFGTPRFKGMSDFTNVGSGNLPAIMRDGRQSLHTSLPYALGSAVGTTLKWTAFAPFAVIGKAFDIAKTLTGTTPITRYFDFRESMLLYYKFVNFLLISISVNMGLRVGFGSLTAQGGAQNYNDRMDGTPEVVKMSEDVFLLLTKRYRRKHTKFGIGQGSIADRITELNTDNLFEEDTGAEDNMDTFLAKQLRILEGTEGTNPEVDSEPDKPGFVDGLLGSMRGSFMYVGFRIEKSTSMDESFDNQTTPPTIVNTLNGMADEARNRAYNLMGGDLGSGALGTIGDVMKKSIESVSAAFHGATGDLTKAATTIMSGNGKFDIPEMWTDSSFNRSYNFDIKLRARYGNPYSILMDLYTPYAFILAGELPRGVGKNMYTSPFLCQAYVRGFFSTTLGIINQVNVQRGADEFGWSNQHLPLCLQLRVSIKDLAPAMFLSMRSAVDDLFNTDTIHNASMEEYLATLGGVTLSSRTAMLHRIFRNKYSAILRGKNTLLNPNFLGAWVGDLAPLSLVRLTPWRDFPERNPSAGNLF